MTTTVLLCTLAAPLLALVLLLMWCHPLRADKPHTVAEAIVRMLWHLARWLTGLAIGLEAGGIAYRDLIAGHPIVSKLEEHRKAVEAARPKPIQEEPREIEFEKIPHKKPYFWLSRRQEDGQ